MRFLAIFLIIVLVSQNSILIWFFTNIMESFIPHFLDFRYIEGRSYCLHDQVRYVGKKPYILNVANLLGVPRQLIESHAQLTVHTEAFVRFISLIWFVRTARLMNPTNRTDKSLSVRTNGHSRRGIAMTFIPLTYLVSSRTALSWRGQKAKFHGRFLSSNGGLAHRGEGTRNRTRQGNILISP